MKSKPLIVPLLLLCGCSGSVNETNADVKEEKYTNVYYEFVRNDNYYKVGIVSETSARFELEKEWKVDPTNVHYVFNLDYIYEDSTIISNEFYVKGSSYKLFVYKKL